VCQVNNSVTFSGQPNNLFSQKRGFSKLKNIWGHSSFVFPHLCLAKSKVCPHYHNYFLRKEDFQNFYGIYKYAIIAKSSGESDYSGDSEIY